MAEKLSEFVEKGLNMLNYKKATYDIHKVEQQSASKPVTNTQVTVISYRVFPETTVKIDAFNAVACKLRYHKSLNTVNVACFFGGAVFATVLVTAILAFKITAPTARFEGNFCFLLADDKQLKFLNSREVSRITNEGGRINFKDTNKHREETVLAGEFSAISLGQASRFNESSESIAATGAQTNKKSSPEEIIPVLDCSKVLPKSTMTMYDALNWLLWARENMPACLDTISGLSVTAKFRNQPDDETVDSDEADSEESESNDD